MTEQSIFYYVDDNSRIMFENAYQAISLTEMWDYMKKDRESFMFSSDKEIEIISKKWRIWDMMDIMVHLLD